ncbi:MULTISPECIES: hypothetical protein [Cysteiniphilum]|uniref:Uncharacterized protein n=1 Tax=Cysteiniphilum litorale TaxID=2056700 RepID=A0A8J2Z2X7_9GAMM|nr:MULTISPECIES: hypothetical protein [Cysteiniphilum]GGF91451.1 hypothetical protein GCM10010995_05850 [Cysteiniphilum litorale]
MYTFNDLIFYDVGISETRLQAKLSFSNGYMLSVVPEYSDPHKYEAAIFIINPKTLDYKMLGDLNGDVFRNKNKDEITKLLNEVSLFDNNAFSTCENLTGLVFYHNWGYEQTNVDFYQVLRATEKSVWLRELETNKIYEGQKSMVGKITPRKDHIKSNPPIRMLYRSNNELGSYKKGLWLSLWDGSPKRFSDYA